jgi:hypothetical protein
MNDWEFVLCQIKKRSENQGINMKKLFLCLTLLGLLAVRSTAANITWQTPATISGPGDASVLGAYFGSWAPYDFSAVGGLTVNGVTFQASPDLPDATDNWTGGGQYYNSPNTSDANYNTLLQCGGDIGGVPLTISWDGMTVGDTYLLQYWVNDGRSYGAGRTETITGGDSTSAALTFGSDTTGPGQYIMGTFVADSASETITVTGNQDSLLNLMQVRDISAVPEPTSLALLAIGGGLVFIRSRK